MSGSLRNWAPTSHPKWTRALGEPDNAAKTLTLEVHEGYHVRAALKGRGYRFDGARLVWTLVLPLTCPADKQPIMDELGCLVADGVELVGVVADAYRQHVEICR